VSDTRHDDEGRTAPYDHTRWDDDPPAEPPAGVDDLEEARENVLEGWPTAAEPFAEDADGEAAAAAASFEPAPLLEPEPDVPVAGPEPLAPAGHAEALEATSYHPGPDQEASLPPADVEADQVAAPVHVSAAIGEHAPGELVVPPGFAVLEGRPEGARRAVGVVVSRFNGEVTTRLLEGALAELERSGVAREAITVMPVPGAFELPLAAMALAKTRRFACVVAIGCVIRGDTPHFEYVAGEAASGLQLAALETGVPVAFGVLTLETADQAEQRLDKGAEAVRTALEMADAFANLRAAAAL
jgi:6,7-dimethyl-8-ribityllumazine synthase